MDNCTLKSYCVIRKFKNSDSIHVGEIIHEATMATVGDYFWAAVFSEILPQVGVVLIALLYVFIGIPFIYCLYFIPTSILFIYAFIWGGHQFKSMELHEDLSNIEQHYHKEEDCGFWVAETYDIMEPTALSMELNIRRKVDYVFITEDEMDNLGLNLHYLKRNIVGTIAITKSNTSTDRAWLRRMAVKKEYRRRGIATKLLDTVIAFCKERPYNGIELVTTECHYKARDLYLNLNFQTEQMYNKSFFNVRQNMYKFYLPLKEKNSTFND